MSPQRNPIAFSSEHFTQGSKVFHDFPDKHMFFQAQAHAQKGSNNDLK